MERERERERERESGSGGDYIISRGVFGVLWSRFKGVLLSL